MKTLDDALDQSFIDLEISPKQQGSIMNYLNLIKQKSERTWGHCVRVGLTGKEVANFTHTINPKALYYPGLLHDVGKVLTNSDSLEKTQNFDERDKKELSRHPADSYRLLRGIHDFSAEVALRHHSFQGERSYPKQLPKSDLTFSRATNSMIDYCARLIGLIDFYDAATYRKNDNFSIGDSKLLTDREVKVELIKENKDQSCLINKLYEVGIFGRAN